MKEYMINSKTLAIIPYLDKKSRVLEVDNYWVINRKPNIIMNHNCMFNGSSMEGRVESTILLTGYTYKSPIMVREDGFLIFFRHLHQD